MARLSTHGDYETLEDRNRREQLRDAVNRLMALHGSTVRAYTTNDLTGMVFPTPSIQPRRVPGGWQITIHLAGGEVHLFDKPLPFPLALGMVGAALALASLAAKHRDEG